MGRPSKTESSTRPITAFFPVLSGGTKTKESTFNIRGYFAPHQKSNRLSFLVALRDTLDQSPKPLSITLGPGSSPDPLSETAEDNDTNESSLPLSSEQQGDPLNINVAGTVKEASDSAPSSLLPSQTLSTPGAHPNNFDAFTDDPNYQLDDFDSQVDKTQPGSEESSQQLKLLTYSYSATTTPTSARTIHHTITSSPFESDLDSIEKSGSYTFGSQVSGESIRRLTLSPRKPKRPLIMGSTLSTPSKSFAERLAAARIGNVPQIHEDPDSGTKDSNSVVFGGGPNSLAIKSEPGIGDEDATIPGSDPESEEDWNDDNIMSPSPTKQPIGSDVSNESSMSPPPSGSRTPETSRLRPPSPEFVYAETKKYYLSSDDDAPTTKKVPLEMADSDSDLEEHPFSITNTPKSPSTGTSTPLPGLTPLSFKEPDLDLELTDDNEMPRRVTRSSSSNNRQMPTRRSTRATKGVPKPNLELPPVKKVVPKKSLFSIDTLLNEKKRREKSGYDVQSLANRVTPLDEEHLEEIGEYDDMESFLSGASTVPRDVLSEEQAEALTEIIEEEDSELVEDIVEFFAHWPKTLSLEPFNPTEADSSDEVVAKVIRNTRSKIYRDVFLKGPFLEIKSQLWTMPRSLFRWLVHVLSVERDQLICMCVNATLQRVLVRRTGTLGVDSLDLIRAFRMYGAKEETLSPSWHATPVTERTLSERDMTRDNNSMAGKNRFPRHNLTFVVNLVNVTARSDPEFYDVSEIRTLILLLLASATDPIIGDMNLLWATTIASLLEAIPDSQWVEERHVLCKEINRMLGTSLPFVLLALHWLSSGSSERLMLVRRGLALEHLGLTPLKADQVAPDLEELHQALFLDEGFAINSKTDYKTLERRIQVVEYCLDDDQVVSSYGAHALVPMVQKLKHMHGRIVDMRAANMSRTRAKQMIQRLYTRLYYSGIHRTGPQQVRLNFKPQHIEHP